MCRTTRSGVRFGTAQLSQDGAQRRPLFSVHGGAARALESAEKLVQLWSVWLLLRPEPPTVSEPRQGRYSNAESSPIPKVNSRPSVAGGLPQWRLIRVNSKDMECKPRRQCLHGD